MAKKDGGNRRQLKEVQVTAKGKSTPKSDTRFGQVATSRVDSMKRANPALGRVIGKPGTGSGGRATYGPDQSDAIKAGLAKSYAAARSKSDSVKKKSSK